MLGQENGKEFLASIVAGYEVGARIGMAVMKDMFWRGVPCAGYYWSFCVCSCGWTDAEARYGPNASCNRNGWISLWGPDCGSRGAMVKRLHFWSRLQSGILVALLARGGFTGITNILEADFGGFCTTLGGDQVEPARLTSGLESSGDS